MCVSFALNQVSLDTYCRSARVQGGGTGHGSADARAVRSKAHTARRVLLQRFCPFAITVALPRAGVSAQVYTHTHTQVYTHTHTHTHTHTQGAQQQQAQFTQTASGLKMYDVVLGTGEEVEEESRVTLHYIGRLAGRQETAWPYYLNPRT